MKALLKSRRAIAIMVSVAVFVLAAVWFAAAISDAEQASKAQQLNAVKSSVEDAVTLCYAFEGAYPQSLDYLKGNYRVAYNEQVYIVHYECFASNIRPYITVLEKGAG